MSGGEIRDTQESVPHQKKSERKITPAMQQFHAAKEQYPDCVIFFRMGDFYETFCEDAEICARELEITLTSRGKSIDGESIPLAGVPYHAVEGYLGRMISKGYKVAICEQIEDPKTAKGIVKRGVVRVVTPGTVIDAGLIGSDRARYLMAVISNGRKKRLGIAFLEISTGEFHAGSHIWDSGLEGLNADIARFLPSECIIPPDTPDTIKNLLENRNIVISIVSKDSFDEKNAREVLLTQFLKNNIQDQKSTDDSSGSDAIFAKTDTSALQAAGAALTYAKSTQFADLNHITRLTTLTTGQMVLDATTLRNLELVANIRDHTETGTLVSTIDMTRTPMGRRLIRKEICTPLTDTDKIHARLDAVDFFIHHTPVRQDIRHLLVRYADVERISGRISYGNASPRDLVTLQDSLTIAGRIREVLILCMQDDLLSGLLYDATHRLCDMSQTISLVSRALVDDPPATTRKGGVIREGYHEILDEIRSISHDGKFFITALEQKEREKTGIKSLKIRYNAIFGYFIEVTKANLHLVPDTYERKQTTANGERFTIPELREMETKIASADEKLLTIEQELYDELLGILTEEVHKLQQIATAIGEIDRFSALAEVALKNRYVRPVLANDERLLIRDGRHPVVEAGMPDGFVPNDALLDAGSDQILIITGANMAGKSTYMRSVALITVMAQMGSFVPASYAHVGVVDRIFTRVGAFDDLASGQSTFMVEMLELATILNNLTEKSLIILDEIGRGTSTLDGYCIAKAVLEYIHGKRIKGARTLFATHFHELVGIEEELKRVKNAHFAVRELGEEITFLRKLIPGATDKSYGIHVAILAGIPDRVTKRAQTLLKEVISGEHNPGGGVKRYTQMILIDAPDSKSPEYDSFINEIADLTPDEMTPLQALNYLNLLREQARTLRE